MEALKPSNFLSIALKRLIKIGPAIASTIKIIGSTTPNTLVTSLLFLIHIAKAVTSIIGALNKPLISIKNVFCTVVISVVVLVISDAVENLSIFENEKVCTFSISAFLIPAPKPIPATEASLAAIAPQKSEHNANVSIFPPSVRIV